MVARVGGPAEVRARAARRSALDARRAHRHPGARGGGHHRPIGDDLAVRLLPALKATVGFAAERGVALVTGGTDAGVFHLLGLALSSARFRPPIVVGSPDDLGVVGPAARPAGQVLGRPPARRARAGPRGRLGRRDPAAVPAGGGHRRRRAVGPAAGGAAGGQPVRREHLAQGRPVVALDGTGRLADSLSGDPTGGGRARRRPAGPGGRGRGDERPAGRRAGRCAASCAGSSGAGPAPAPRPPAACGRCCRSRGSGPPSRPRRCRTAAGEFPLLQGRMSEAGGSSTRPSPSATCGPGGSRTATAGTRCWPSWGAGNDRGQRRSGVAVVVGVARRGGGDPRRGRRC